MYVRNATNIDIFKRNAASRGTYIRRIDWSYRLLQWGEDVGIWSADYLQIDMSVQTNILLHEYN